MGSFDKQHSSSDERNVEHFTDLSGQFLLAMPGVDSDLFNGTVIYLFEHSPEGAGGVIVNRATDIELSDLVERFELEAPADYVNKTIFFGGPVQPMRGFVLHPPLKTTDVDSTSGHKDVLLQISNSSDMLQDYLLGKGPEDVFICFGYAGWDEGQLERELSANVWLTVPADHDLIFKRPPYDCYQAALASLGIDISHFSTQAGHA